jgi:hypothetical protein
MVVGPAFGLSAFGVCHVMGICVSGSMRVRRQLECAAAGDEGVTGASARVRMCVRVLFHTTPTAQAC